MGSRTSLVEDDLCRRARAALGLAALEGAPALGRAAEPSGQPREQPARSCSEEISRSAAWVSAPCASPAPDLGRPARPGGCAQAPAPRGRPRREPHRHGRRVWPGSERAAHPRGAAPVPEGSGHRHEGRSHRPARERGRSTPGRSTSARHAKRACAACGSSDRPLPAPRPGSEGAAGGLHGRARAVQREGKIRHVGVSNVSVDELRLARSIVKVVSVQNRYNVGDRRSEDVLASARRRHRVPSLGAPGRPRARGEQVPVGRGARAARTRSHGISETQAALAWLLARSPVILPIPGRARWRTSRRTSPRRRCVSLRRS